MLSRFINRYPRISRYIDRWVNPQVSQEDMDMYNASVLLMAHTWHKQHNASKEMMDDQQGNQFYDRVDRMTKQQRQVFVQTEMSKQVEHMFRCMHDVMVENNENSLMNVYHPPSEKPTTSIHKETYQNRKSKHQPSSSSSSMKLGKDYIRDKVGFEINLRSSSVSGNGVFIDNDILPGTVIALFGGNVHPLEFIHETYLEDNHLIPDDNFMLMVRTDGHIIDGNTAKENEFNPYALAHMVNHPPKDVNPNVMAVQY